MYTFCKICIRFVLKRIRFLFWSVPYPVLIPFLIPILAIPLRLC